MKPPTSLSKALLLLTAPMVEFLTSRILLREVWGVRIGYVGMTDYDFALPGLISFILLVGALDKRQPLNLAFRARGAVTNLVFLILFLLLSYRYFSLKTLFPITTPLVWLIVGIGVMVSAIFVFISPSQVTRHPLRTLCFPALICASSTILAKNFLSSLWAPATKLTGEVVCALIQPFSNDLSCVADTYVHSLGPYHMMAHPLHTVMIGVGCGGLEGVFFFVFSATLIWISYSERFTVFSGIFFIALGALGMYVTNMLRIAIYFTVSILITQWIDSRAGLASIRFLFHASLGWMLYGIYLFVYLRLWTKRLSQFDSSESALYVLNRLPPNSIPAPSASH
jgi:exosortase/archaeosortase family protein